MVLAQFWVPVKFESATVLTTRGQPFGLSVWSDELWAYRTACLDYCWYVNDENSLCMGVPGRVYFSGCTEWSFDIDNYSAEKYPQKQVAVNAKIGGSLVMPVFDGDKCVGVLEIVLTNAKGSFTYERNAVLRALEVG